MNRKLKLMISFLAVLIGMIWTVKPVSAASDINIDGDVSDWDQVTKVTTSSKAQVAMIVRDGMLYYYVASNPTGVAPANDNGWAASNKFSLQAYELTVGNKVYNLTPQSKKGNNYQVPSKIGDKSEVDVNVYSNGGYNNNGKASGYVSRIKSNSKDGYQDVFEGRVALSDLELKDTDTEFKLSGGGYNLGNYTVKTANDTKAPVVPGDDGSKGDGGSSYKGHANINIDGGFDDWSDITKTKIRETGDDYNVKEGALLQYNGDVYIYINMSPHMGNGYAALQPSGYKLTIGNKTYDLTVKNTNGDKYTSLNSTGETKNIIMDIYDSQDNKYVGKPAGVDGSVTRKATDAGGDTDIFEIKIPLKDFVGSSDDGQTISLVNHNLGDQKMVATGGSTGPVVLASIGFGIALFGLWQFDRRKKHNEVTK